MLAMTFLSKFIKQQTIVRCQVVCGEGFLGIRIILPAEFDSEVVILLWLLIHIILVIYI